MNDAKAFHEEFGDTYHKTSYAHYGADVGHAAWHRVFWQVQDGATVPDLEALQIVGDSMNGTLRLRAPGASGPRGAEPARSDLRVAGTATILPNLVQSRRNNTPPDLGRIETEQNVTIAMQPARDPGDQTVPLHSSDRQFLTGKFSGIFRQTGYEHQDSYKNENALRSTLYSVVRIALLMKWAR